MNKLNELIKLTEIWADDVGITLKGNPEKQAEKVIEEANELFTAIKSGDKSQIIDELGDVMVTIIIEALLVDVKLEECLFLAYQKIKNRVGKGEMRNGTFVKAEDL